MNLVNHYCTYPHGGAATAALRLHRTLLHQRQDSKFFYLLSERGQPRDLECYPLTLADTSASYRIPGVSNYLAKRQLRQTYRLYNEHLADRPSHLESFSMAKLPHATYLDWDKQSSNIVHLHWIAHLADYPTFFQSIPESTPIVWTLHDMNPLTGGCHFSGGCERFTGRCGNCPQVNQPHADDVSRASWLVKQQSLRRRNLHVVAPSRWLLNLAQRSPIWPQSTVFSWIPYGLDLHGFAPHEQRIAQRNLNLDPAKTTIGFVADDIANPRKGMSWLWQGLMQRQTNQPVQLVTMGAGRLPSQPPPMASVHPLGFVDSVEKQSEAFSACDFVIVPSLEDNLPQVAMEAMACGTPVVGFDVGGLPELIEDRIDGLLVSRGNGEQLAAAFDWLIANPDSCRHMGRRARLKMERNYAQELQAERYSEIYRQRLSETRGRRRAG